MMRTEEQKFRFLSRPLAAPTTVPRLLILTGARQTGKTTLARVIFPHLNYLSFDAIEQRELVQQIRTDAWAQAIGPAVLDEAQKVPGVFDKVKYAFDAGQISTTVLLGSSQILMLQRVRETLAGRAFVYELWPLMASELAAPASAPAPMPLLDQLLAAPGSADDLLAPLPNVQIGEANNRGAQAIEHLLAWGGMPALLPLPDAERRKWLSSYATAYLERDLGDLARLTDLMPFHRFQRLCALRSGQLLSYSELARDAGLSASTARRYVEYLRLSYQALLLPPFAANLTSSIIKTPKVYWLDVGLLRQQSQYFGPVTGALFETLVVTEIYKWIKTLERAAELAFYRTRSGLEVDLLISTSHGVWGLEIKSAARLGRGDWRGLRDIGAALASQWRGGLVVYRGDTLERLGPQVWAVPVSRLLV